MPRRLNSAPAPQRVRIVIDRAPPTPEALEERARQRVTADLVAHLQASIRRHEEAEAKLHSKIESRTNKNTGRTTTGREGESVFDLDLRPTRRSTALARDDNLQAKVAYEGKDSKSSHGSSSIQVVVSEVPLHLSGSEGSDPEKGTKAGKGVAYVVEDYNTSIVVPPKGDRRHPSKLERDMEIAMRAFTGAEEEIKRRNSSVEKANKRLSRTVSTMSRQGSFKVGGGRGRKPRRPSFNSLYDATPESSLSRRASRDGPRTPSRVRAGSNAREGTRVRTGSRAPGTGTGSRRGSTASTPATHSGSDTDADGDEPPQEFVLPEGAVRRKGVMKKSGITAYRLALGEEDSKRFKKYEELREVSLLSPLSRQDSARTDY